MKPILVLFALVCPLLAADFTATALRCEYHDAPLAIATTQPRFSWKLKPTDDAARDIHQSAYEIQVAREADGFAETTLVVRENRFLRHRPNRLSRQSVGVPRPGRLARPGLG